MTKPLSLITDQIKDLVESSMNSMSIKKYELGFMNRFSIGRITVKINKGGSPIMDLPENVNKDYLKLWKNDVGDVLLKELSKDTLELYEFVTANFKALVKKISDEELDKFLEKGFVHIILADSRYTIIKAVPSKKSYSDSSDDYDLDEDYDDIKSQIIDQEDVLPQQNENDSYELF